MKTFKLKISILIFAVLAGVGMATAQTNEKADGPKIVFDELTYDFGTINVGDKGEFEIKFTNGGIAPLIVKSVQGCCGASITDYTKDPVLPQKSGSVKVKIYTGSAGAVGKTITITSNDAENPAVRVQLKGTIKSIEASGK